MGILTIIFLSGPRPSHEVRFRWNCTLLVPVLCCLLLKINLWSTHIYTYTSGINLQLIFERRERAFQDLALHPLLRQQSALFRDELVGGFLDLSRNLSLKSLVGVDTGQECMYRVAEITLVIVLGKLQGRRAPQA